MYHLEHIRFLRHLAKAMVSSMILCLDSLLFITPSVTVIMGVLVFVRYLCKSSRSAVAENRRMLLAMFNRSELFEIEKTKLQEYFLCSEICKNEGDLLKELSHQG